MTHGPEAVARSHHNILFEHHQLPVLTAARPTISSSSAPTPDLSRRPTPRRAPGLLLMEPPPLSPFPPPAPPPPPPNAQTPHLILGSLRYTICFDLLVATPLVLLFFFKRMDDYVPMVTSRARGLRGRARQLAAVWGASGTEVTSRCGADARDYLRVQRHLLVALAVVSGASRALVLPIRPRRRGERRSLRTFPGVSLRPGSLAFNPDTPRRLSTPRNDA